MYEPYVRLAARLNALVGGSGPRKSLFVTTGAEAVENAVKIARAYTNRPGVVAFTGGFHGRTLLAMSLTGLTHAYKQNFGPSAPEIYRAPYPYEYRGWTADRAIGALEELFKTQIASNRIAAIIIEPELGDGGFVPAPASFMRELRRITERHGIILIVDEIQTGFGRTGHLFGFRHSDIEPDLVVVAKSLAGGLPLSGVVGHAHIMDSAEPGGLGGTYAGNPLACAAALAVLDIVEEEELVERARDLGTRLRSGLESLRRRFASIGDVRGLGAMLAIELVRDRETREPDPGLTARLLERTREHGVLLLKCGIFGNVVRVLMPLIAQEEDVNRCIEVLGLAFEEAA